MRLTLISLPLLLFALPILGQVTVDRALLNPPKPVVPEEANKTGLGGTVKVLVEVDPAGNVTSIKDTQGPDWVCPSVARPDVVALREAAKIAAQNVKFAQISGSDLSNSTLWLDVSFPKAASTQEGEDERYFTAAPVAEKTGAGEKDADKDNVFTVKGDRERSTVSASDTQKNLPADYAGLVNPAPSDTNKYTIVGDRDFKAVSPGRSLSGGVLNGKAVALPKPSYPPAARAVRASGAVSIQVLIEENGKIFSARPVSGHPLLRSAARVAACSAEFSPTYLESQPVKVSGVITYNFVP